jgi:hypothetical protein
VKRLGRRTAISLGLLVIAACSTADGPADLGEVLARLEAELGEDGMSAGARRYYEDLYGESLDADEVRFASFSDHGRAPLGLPVILLAKAGGYETGGTELLAARVEGHIGAPSPVLIHDGVAVIVLGADEETADRVLSALDQPGGPPHRSHGGRCVYVRMALVCRTATRVTDSPTTRATDHQPWSGARRWAVRRRHAKTSNPTVRSVRPSMVSPQFPCDPVRISAFHTGRHALSGGSAT